MYELQGDWERVLALSANTNVFLTFEWLTTWWRNFKGGRELWVIVAERNSEVIGIAPLAVSRNRLCTELEFLGRPGSDYSDFIWNPDNLGCLGSLLEFLWRGFGGDIVTLAGIREDSGSFGPLVAAFQKAGRPACYRPSYPAPYLTIDRGWDDYRKRVRKKLLQDTGRQVRRLQELGTLVFDQCLDPGTINSLIDEMVAQKRARFRATGAKDAFKDGRLIAFYHEIAEIFRRKGWLDLSYVRLDDTTLAVHFGFVYCNRFYYYMPSFNGEYAVYSPSRVLLNHQLQHAFNDGLTEFEFPGWRRPIQV